MSSHKFKKYFGQNFLKTSFFAKKIAEKIDDGIKNLIEVGPGDGKLTEQLIEKGFIVNAVEIDSDVYPKLIKKFGTNQNFTLTPEDILNFKTDDLKAYNYSVVGNLPYNISKKIIKKFIELKNPPFQMLFMIQKEVAEDYAAKVPKATFLSNFVSLFGQCEYLFTVSKNDFHPTPKVDGGVISIRLKNQVDIKLIKFIKIGFQNPRKTLLNSLSSVYEKKEIQKIFSELKISDNKRAAELEIEEWKSLYKLVAE